MSCSNSAEIEVVVRNLTMLSLRLYLPPHYHRETVAQRSVATQVGLRINADGSVTDTGVPTQPSTQQPTEGPTVVQTSPETDREVLIAFYNATGGPNWKGNNNWLSDVPINEWDGVTTDGNGRVTELSLLGNQLSGEIPPELGNLPNLKYLYLDQNQLSGCVPSSLSGRLAMEISDLGDLRFCS